MIHAVLSMDVFFTFRNSTIDWRLYNKEQNTKRPIHPTNYTEESAMEAGFVGLVNMFCQHPLDFIHQSTPGMTDLTTKMAVTVGRILVAAI